MVITVPLCAAFWQMVSTPEPPQLGPGPRPGVLERREIESRLDRFVADHELPADAALRLRATALLYHDQHDPAHDLVQDLSDGDGALIHAMLHRREPDYWNAKYWFRRVEGHPVYLSLGRRISATPDAPESPSLVRELTLPGSFDPFAFVDLCEREQRSPDDAPAVRWLRGVQQAEFEELVRHLSAV